jgi:hypothetical protein
LATICSLLPWLFRLEGVKQNQGTQQRKIIHTHNEWQTDYRNWPSRRTFANLFFFRVFSVKTRQNEVEGLEGPRQGSFIYLSFAQVRN